MSVKNEGLPLAAIREISSPEITAIYGGAVTIPYGWELVAREPRDPKGGEWWLSVLFNNPPVTSVSGEDVPRLIVRKATVVEAAKPKREVINGGVNFYTSSTTTVKDIYGVDEVEIPEGYRYVGFRVPKQGARELGLNSRTQEVITFAHAGDMKPRIIVEKVEPPKPTKPTYEFVIHTVETPGSIDKVRYMATTDVDGETHFYCHDFTVPPPATCLSPKNAPILYLNADVLESVLLRRFPGCTVRRAKGVQQ